MGTQKCISRNLSAAATVIDPLKLLLALTGTQNLGGIPATAAQSHLPPTNTCKSFLGPMNVNNGGDKSLAALFVDRIGMDKTYFRVEVRKIFSFMF